MPRFNTLLTAGTAITLALAARSATAQNEVSSAPESVAIAPMVVTAKKLSGNELLRENRKLRSELAAYDRRITYLQRRLVELKTVVTDSLQRDIAKLHASTDSTRAQRQTLEARLGSTETKGGRPLAKTSW